MKSVNLAFSDVCVCVLPLTRRGISLLNLYYPQLFVIQLAQAVLSLIIVTHPVWTNFLCKILVEVERNSWRKFPHFQKYSDTAITLLIPNYSVVPRRAGDVFQV